MASASSDSNDTRHAGPPLGIVAIVFVVLFLAGLYPVTMFGGQPYFPGPWESADTIVTFFQNRSSGVLATAFLHFGAAIPLGIFTATVVSRLQLLGVRAAGAFIALFGGLATAFTMIVSSSILWTMAQPGIAQDRTLVQALYWLDQALGGSGFSVPFGLLLAGISIPAALMKLLPKWLIVLGIFDRGLWRIELDQLDRSQGAFSCAVDAVSGICVADRRRICHAENGRSIMTKRIRAFVFFECVAFTAAALTHFGILVNGYEHQKAGTAKSVIALVLLVGLILMLYEFIDVAT